MIEKKKRKKVFFWDVLNEVHSLEGIAESGTIELIVDEPRGFR